LLAYLFTYLLAYLCNYEPPAPAPQIDARHWKAITRVRSDHIIIIFSSSDCELWPVTLTVERDLNMAKKYYLAEYLSHRAFRSIVIVRTDTQTHNRTIALRGPQNDREIWKHLCVGCNPIVLVLWSLAIASVTTSICIYVTE